MRSLSTVLFLISCFFVKFARSQSHELLIQGQTGKLYLEHTVVAKDNWYSVGRLYNITPKELSAFNQLAMTQPLTIGQTLQIPLIAENFSQTGQKVATETLVPVYHIVQEKEWMYRVSVNHNKVAIPSLEKWNNIKGDQVHAGVHMIVGFLKVKTALSALAASGAQAPVAAAAPAGGVPGSVGTPAGAAAAKAPTAEKVVGTDKAIVEKPVGTPVKQVSAPVTSGEGEKPAIVKPAVEKPAVEKPVEKPAVVPATGGGQTAAGGNGGVFKGDFNESGKSASGLAGTFKSTSGWQDGKYYALMNSAPVGTIVKVSDAATGKSVFAKVLGVLPDMKESAGLMIRISNAAASELGQGEGRFNVEVKY